MDDYKYCFSFRKFVILKDYDIDCEIYDYGVYVRVGLFLYHKLGNIDSILFGEMDEYEK